jgi:signal transduction histidine kinase
LGRRTGIVVIAAKVRRGTAFAMGYGPTDNPGGGTPPGMVVLYPIDEAPLMGDGSSRNAQAKIRLSTFRPDDDEMKAKLNALSRSYEAALAKHLKGPSNETSLKGAATLGARAVTLRLETLELAKIHEEALDCAIRGMKSSRRRESLVKQAQIFFIEANFQIERTHGAAARARLHWNRLNKTLQARVNELAISKRDVKNKMVQRKEAEEMLKARNNFYEKSLLESRTMQESLRALAHRVLLAQESERGKISRKLHDEIAEVLLGINVRLLMLEQKGARDASALLKDIASTQRLVDKSVHTLRRTTRKLRRRDET